MSAVWKFVGHPRPIVGKPVGSALMVAGQLVFHVFDGGEA